VQLVRRQWKRLSFAFNLALVVVLALLGTGGMVFKTQVGIAQAQHYAAAGDWTDALKQYTLLTSDPSCGHDCQRAVTSGAAHAHYEYGYQLEGEKNYQKAISQFEASLTAAPAGLDAVPAHLELSHTHYSYGLQFASQKEYLEAVSEFEQAVNVAPSGPYAQKAHLATASAFYAAAQQYLAGSSCQSAVLALETIVRSYSDAPEAKQAKADLAAPVKVMGTLTGYPVNPTPQVWLSKKAHAPHCCAPAAPGAYSFSGDYRTTVDPKTGGYVFAHVPPGMYTLSTFRQVGSSWAMTWWYASNDSDLFFLQVGPICTVTWPILSCNGLCR
jgi:tetratricopeptide (TPR) repeat protein